MLNPTQSINQFNRLSSRKNVNKLAAMLRGSRPGVESASLIMTSLMTSLFGFKMEIAKMARENFSIGAFYNITN